MYEVVLPDNQSVLRLVDISGLMVAVEPRRGGWDGWGGGYYILDWTCKVQQCKYCARHQFILDYTVLYEKTYKKVFFSD